MTIAIKNFDKNEKKSFSAWRRQKLCEFLIMIVAFFVCHFELLSHLSNHIFPDIKIWLMS